jgi:NAD(P)-dependent dehydrogenase (short-subunit alcohol dehydrogenase family)
LIIVADPPLGRAVAQALAGTDHTITLHAADDADDIATTEAMARALASQPLKDAEGNIVILLTGSAALIGPEQSPAQAPEQSIKARAQEARAKDALKQSNFNALTRSLALELAPTVRVNAINIKGTRVDARVIADTVLFVLATRALTGQMITLGDEIPT